MEMNITTKKTYIVTITCWSWDNYFVRSSYGKRAIARSGWGSFNLGLLSFPEIRSTKVVVTVNEGEQNCEQDGKQQHVATIIVDKDRI